MPDQIQSKTEERSPLLEKPGAGLPFFESLYFKYYLGPFVARRSEWSEARERFERINEKILTIVKTIPQESLEKRVLVPRLPGLEDSSRFWSIGMTLEHITLVGKQMKDLIILLSKGEVPPVKVDVAKVKPSGRITAGETLKEFKMFAETTMNEIKTKIKDPESRSALSHPWFGPFTARQWHWLLGAHSAIHYKQIKEIKLRL